MADLEHRGSLRISDAHALGAVLLISVVVFLVYPSALVFTVPLLSLIFYLYIRGSQYSANLKPEEFFLHSRQMNESDFVPSFVSSNIGLFSSIIFSMYMLTC